MADKSKIEWTDATPIIDRGGRRVHYYQRLKTDDPGTQMRRTMRARGLKWCRDCAAWLPLIDVTKNGLCKEHARVDYRKRYAENPEPIRRRVHARKRNVEPVPPEAEAIAELFNHSCAYCGSAYQTWDHVYPVSRGGQTVPGNMVPACISCNSSKNNLLLEEWLDKGAPFTEYLIEYLSSIKGGIWNANQN